MNDSLFMALVMVCMMAAAAFAYAAGRKRGEEEGRSMRAPTSLPNVQAPPPPPGPQKRPHSGGSSERWCSGANCTDWEQKQ